jgi:hypothetical protein
MADKKYRMKDGDRSFTIAGSDIGFQGGRYRITSAEGPLQAARRAATKLFGHLKDKKYASSKNSNTIRFIMRETTAGTTKDRHAYKATREALKKPLEIRDKKGELLWTVNYEYSVHACGHDEVHQKH